MASTTVEPRALSKQAGYWNRFDAWWRVFPHALVIVAFVVGFFFAHELGHAIVAQLFGARIVMFNVLGMQWYPRLEWMPHLGFGGYVYWFAPVNLNNHRLIVMAGSTTTLLIALFASISLIVFRTRGLIQTALIVMSLYFLDSLFKTVVALGWLPFWLNSRFLRSFSEAHFAAIGMGIPPQVVTGTVFTLSVLIVALIILALWRARSASLQRISKIESK